MGTKQALVVRLGVEFKDYWRSRSRFPCGMMYVMLVARMGNTGIQRADRSTEQNGPNKLHNYRYTHFRRKIFRRLLSRPIGIISETSPSAISWPPLIISLQTRNDKRRPILSRLRKFVTPLYSVRHS